MFLLFFNVPRVFYNVALYVKWITDLLDFPVDPDTVPLAVVEPEVVGVELGVEGPAAQVDAEHELAGPDREGDVVHAVAGVEQEHVERDVPVPRRRLEVQADLVQLRDDRLVAAGRTEVVPDVLRPVERRRRRGLLCRNQAPWSRT